MNIREFAKGLDARVATGEAGLDKSVSGVYVCDLLSWVMSHASKGDAWVTVHTHLNIVAVAVLTEAACIIIPEDIGIEEATIRKAQEEGIAILSTKLTAYEVCCKASKLICNS